MPKPKAEDLATMVRARSLETPPPGDVFAQAQTYVQGHRQHKARIARLDAITDERWQTVWPDGTTTTDVALISDFISSDLDDFTSSIAGPEPSTLVPSRSDRDADTRVATRLQNILATYREVNNRHLQRHTLAMDLVGTGLACEVIWPDFKTGYPRYMRRDPRIVYPDPDLTDPAEVSSVVVAYQIQARVLAKAYPNAPLVSELFTAGEARDWESRWLQIYEFYDGDWCLKVAGTPSGAYARKQRAFTLVSIPNLVGKPLAVLAARTTSDAQFRGQFDKSISPLRTANRMMEMKLAQVADEIYAEKIIRGSFDNPDDVGPGATLTTMDYQASITRAETARSSLDFYQDINLLVEQSREAGGVSSARSRGGVPQNIISGQGITALQGKQIQAVMNYQYRLADMERRSNQRALAVDELYLDSRDKPLVGTAGGSSTSGTYTPSIDIAGRYDNRVTFGAGSAMDAYNQRLSNIQSVEYRLVSRRHAMSQLPDVEDPIAMEAEIHREALEDGFTQGMAMPDTPLELRVQALALAAEGKSVAEIARVMNEAMQAAQAQQAEQQTVAEAALGVAPGTQSEGEIPALPALPNVRGGF